MLLSSSTSLKVPSYQHDNIDLSSRNRVNCEGTTSAQIFNGCPSDNLPIRSCKKEIRSRIVPEEIVCWVPRFDVKASDVSFFQGYPADLVPRLDSKNTVADIEATSNCETPEILEERECIGSAIPIEEVNDCCEMDLNDDPVTNLQQISLGKRLNKVPDQLAGGGRSCGWLARLIKKPDKSTLSATYSAVTYFLKLNHSRLDEYFVMSSPINVEADPDLFQGGAIFYE